MDLAHALVGVRERIAGGALNPIVRTLFAHTRFPPSMVSVSTSWCAAFACAMLERAGYDSPHSARARDFLRWGGALVQPRYGAIMVFSRGDSAELGHVGFYERMTEQGGVLVLGGNQANSVGTAVYPPERVLGMRWPLLPPRPVGGSGTLPG